MLQGSPSTRWLKCCCADVTEGIGSLWKILRKGSTEIPEDSRDCHLWWKLSVSCLTATQILSDLFHSLRGKTSESISINYSTQQLDIPISLFFLDKASCVFLYIFTWPKNFVFGQILYLIMCFSFSIVQYLCFYFSTPNIFVCGKRSESSLVALHQSPPFFNHPIPTNIIGT